MTPGQLPTLVQGMESMFSRIGGLLSNPEVSPPSPRRHDAAPARNRTRHLNDAMS
jgi:hypothetical protein